MCIAHRHEASLDYIRTCARSQLLRAFLCSREENWIAEFDLLSKPIFKHLAVPAVTTLGSWFVLAVAMFY